MFGPVQDVWTCTKSKRRSAPAWVLNPAVEAELLLLPADQLVSSERHDDADGRSDARAGVGERAGEYSWGGASAVAPDGGGADDKRRTHWRAIESAYEDPAGLAHHRFCYAAALLCTELLDAVAG